MATTRPPPKKLSGQAMLASNSDYALLTAAQRLVSTSLSLFSGDRLLIVSDRSRAEIAAALVAAARALDVETVALVLEDLAPRPHVTLHAAVRAAIAQVRASVMPIAFEAHELDMRSEMVALAARAGLRHAHMVGVTRTSLIVGMAVDPRRIARIAGALLVRIRPGSVLHVKSASGTDLVVRCEPQYRWVECSGVIAPGRRDNVPSGELLTCPATADGVYVADGSISDADGVLSGRITPSLRLRVTGGRVAGVESADRSLAARVSERLRRGPNVDRVGQVSFGINVGISTLQEDFLADQKRPGFHLSTGATSAAVTGASWNAPSWVGFTAQNSDVDIDGTPVMRAGRYLIA